MPCAAGSQDARGTAPRQQKARQRHFPLVRGCSPLKIELERSCRLARSRSKQLLVSKLVVLKVLKGKVGVLAADCQPVLLTPQVQKREGFIGGSSPRKGQYALNFLEMLVEFEFELQIVL